MGRGDADDVLIVRNELITDTSIANVAFMMGVSGILLRHHCSKGLKELFIGQTNYKGKEITLKQLFTYSRITLFNAMIEFGQIEFPVKKHIIV